MGVKKGAGRHIGQKRYSQKVLMWRCDGGTLPKNYIPGKKNNKKYVEMKIVN